MKTLIALILLPLLCSNAYSMELPFVPVEYPTALKQAKAANKTVFLAIVMNSCNHCQAFKKTVLSDPAFQKFAASHLVLSVYDYEEMDSMSRAKQKQLNTILNRYDVNGLPTILLLRPDGSELLKSSGYGGSSAQDVIALFKKRIASQKTILSR